MSVRLRDFSPPIVTRIARKAIKTRRKGDIFDGQGELFKESLAGCGLYAEYGMGESTRWVLENTNADVIAVDSSREWVNRVMSLAHNTERLNATWVDVGSLGDWGWPLTYANRDNFISYVEAPWGGAPNRMLCSLTGDFVFAAS